MPAAINDERVLRCPSCGQDDGGFAIDAMAPRIVYVDACEDSYDEKDSGDCSYDWGNDNSCRCVKCGHTSKLRDFRQQRHEPRDGFGPIHDAASAIVSAIEAILTQCDMAMRARAAARAYAQSAMDVRAALEATVTEVARVEACAESAILYEDGSVYVTWDDSDNAVAPSLSDMRDYYDGSHDVLALLAALDAA